MAVKDESARRELDDVVAALREAEARLERLGGRLAVEGGGGETVSQIAARHGVSAEALEAFAESAGRALAGASLDPVDARRAGLLAASQTAWEGELGPLLSSAEVAELLGGVSRQRVSELLRDRRVIAVREGRGRWRYPLFQFHEARLLQALVEAFWLLASASVSAWTAAAWCTAPDAALDGQSPLGWARAGREREWLLRVARQDAARLSH